MVAEIVADDDEGATEPPHDEGATEPPQLEFGISCKLEHTQTLEVEPVVTGDHTFTLK